MSREHGHSPQRWRWLVAGVVSALVVAGGGVLLLGPGRDWLPVPGAGTEASPVDPAPAAPATEEGDLGEDEAVDVIGHIVRVPVDPVETSGDLEALFGNVATGGYLAEIEAHWQEMMANGWTVSGEPEVVSAEVTKLDAGAEPATATVSACIDSSAVRMLDSEGEPIGAAEQAPALNTYTLMQDEGGSWRIASHAFPDDPEC